MNVAYLIGHLNRGGAETLLLDVFKRGKEVPFNLTLIHRHGGSYEEEFHALAKDDMGPSVFRLCPTKWKHFNYLLQLRSIFQSKQIEVVHAQSWLDCIYGKIASFGLPIKVVVTMHGYMGAECRDKGAIRYKLTFLLVDMVCFVSKYEQSCYLKRYGKLLEYKSRVVYNGVDGQKFPLINDNNNPCPQLCMVGNFNEVRTQRIVVEAIKILKDRGIVDFSFVFVGSRYKGQEWMFDECVVYCQTHDLQNVHFLGARDDVPQLLKDMDGFVYSSQNDTFGIAVVEAMFMGLPVVVNDYPVMREITHEGEWATLFESNNAEDCADKIGDLLANMQRCKQEASQLVSAIRTEYSIDKHIKRLYEIYKD